ncbi:PaaI family thioesterase [Haloterrigena alkaliphila]|uniref:PaaI family thioesterase n=1 Tax=Haloterrigena alkaliphila TaxID=2816475 RepID=A0A8A2VI79_9EURY|nr:PaaI family thioesterase [Haloterrigena alkaliphila]QSX00358.1 PaaI family thioesterase [Haloterrigena alkaliphila]
MTEDDAGFSELIGLEFTDAGDGYSRGTLTVSDRLTNPNDVLHGGVAYTMADSGMAAALQSEMTADERCATIEIKISYLEPVTEGTVTCESTVVRRGGSVAFLESEVQQEGASVARATGSFSIFVP